MIFESLVAWIVSICTFLLTFLPETDIDTINFINSGVLDFRSRLAQADWVFPVNTFLTVMTFFLTIEFIILVFKLIKFFVPKPLGSGQV